MFKQFIRSGLLFTAAFFLAAPLSAAPESKGPPEQVRQAFQDRFAGTENKGILRAIEAQERHTAELLKNDGVVGTAVGLNENNESVIKVFTKLSASSAGIPETLDGIPVVVEATGRIYAQIIPCEQREECDPDVYEAQSSAGEPASQQDWHSRPVPIGVSIGPENEYTSGTLACRVSSGCHQYALTNNHVVAGENSNPLGNGMLQPGRYDGGINPTNEIGQLFDFVPIVFSTNPSTNNRVDAAIVSVTNAEVGIATRSDGYGTPKSNIVAPMVLMQVLKYGRTTGQTDGFIDAINASVQVEYDSGTALFKGQIIIRKNGGGNFSGSGDSGSLIVASGGTNNRKPVGLLFASGTGITVANPISEVLAAFDVDIDGQ